MVERTAETRGHIFETKISQLDALLKDGGIVVPDTPDGVSVLLKGPTGAGKSTLALLLAARCAKDGGPCLYCALEQSAYSLKRLAHSLNADEEGWCWLSENEQPPPVEDMTGFICVTALRTKKREPDFEDYLALVTEQAERYTQRHGAEKTSMVLIDSLNVFGPVSRLEFERLKRALSSRNRILIFIGAPEEEARPEVWDRLVDMVIELGSKTPLEYLLRTICISKARFQNHILGSHVIKIKGISPLTQEAKEGPKADQPSDFGFFVYPSLHYHLSVAIERRRRLGERREDTRLLKTGFKALDEALGGGVKRSTMTAISSDLSYAARGIGLSFLAQGVKDEDRSLYLSLQDDPESITKFPSEHNLSGMVEEGNLVIRSFRPGFISAEELVDKIIQEILDTPRLNAKFQRVVFDDVSQIGLRFPLLEIAPVFLPTLMDIFKLYDMTALFLSGRIPSEASGVSPKANLNDLVSTVIEIEGEGVGSENEALVRIRKIAEQFYVPQPLRLSIDRKVGGRIQITK